MKKLASVLGYAFFFATVLLGGVTVFWGLCADKGDPVPAGYYIAAAIACSVLAAAFAFIASRANRVAVLQ